MSYTILFIASIFLLLLYMSVNSNSGLRSESIPNGGAERRGRSVKTSVSAAGLPYLLSVPSCSELHSLPLVLFLHGAGESGNDPWDLLPGYDSASKSWLHSIPAPVRVTPPGLAVDAHPFCEGIAILAPITSKGWSSFMHTKLLGLLDEVLASDSCINPSHIVLTGISMGGGGTWLLGASHPQRFAKLSPICGYHYDQAKQFGEALRNTPLFVAHGKNDVVVPVGLSHELVEAVRMEGNSEVIFDEANGVTPAGHPTMIGHDSWSAVYGSKAWWDWVREK